MSIQFGNFKILFIGILLTFLIYGGRLLLSRILISKETPNSEAAMISFIIPKGLAAAVLAEVPMHMGLPINALSTFTEIRSIIYIVILLSILLTAFLIYGQESGMTKNRYEKFYQHQEI